MGQSCPGHEEEKLKDTAVGCGEWQTPKITEDKIFYGSAQPISTCVFLLVICCVVPLV
ncbi:hypothetical protein Syun_001468 [Stephania yunnanensis]|uniref:Uncharacterized protein n=1 Tax=Stephania yunnanensis TaxID=152371 RepID=A0AAP0Q748_9MAGN